MAEPEITGVSSARREGSGPLVVPLPPGSGGTVWVLIGGWGLTSPTAPSGWTLAQYNNTNTNAPYASLVAENPAADLTITVSTNADAAVLAYAMRINATGMSGFSAAGGNTSLISPSATASGETLVVRALFADLNDVPPAAIGYPSNATVFRSTREYGATGSGVTISVAAAASTGGSTGTATWTHSKSTSTRAVTFLLTGTVPSPPATVAVAAGGSVTIVAHQDDDTSMIAPYPYLDALAGPYAAVVYITAGNAGAAWGSAAQARETGVKAAYAQATGQANLWVDGTVTIAGKTVNYSALRGAPVRLYFLRLPDNSNNDIARLWQGTISTVSSVDAAVSYSAADLTAVLAGIIDLHQAATVRTMNPRDEFGAELHLDHVGTGRFGHAAVVAATTPGIVEVPFLNQQFMGLPANLSTGNKEKKEAGDRTYISYDPAWTPGWESADYIRFWERTYPLSFYTAASGSGTAATIFGTGAPTLTTGTSTTATIHAVGFNIDAGSETVIARSARLYFNAGTNSAVDGTGYVAHLWRADSSGYPVEWVAAAVFGTVGRGSWQVANFAQPVVLPPGRYVLAVTFPRGRASFSANRFASTGQTSPNSSRLTAPATGTQIQGLARTGGLVSFHAPPETAPNSNWPGIDVGLELQTATVTVPADVGGLTLTGVTPTLTGSSVIIPVDPAVLSLTGLTSSLTGTSATITADPATITLTSPDPSLAGTGSAPVALDPATVTLTGVTPATDSTIVVPVDPAVLSLSAQSSELTGSGVASITPDIAVLALASVTPGAAGTGTATTTLDTALLSLSGQTPAPAGVGQAPAPAEPAALTLAGVTPQIEGGPIVVTVEPASLTLTGISPQVDGGPVIVRADAATLTLTAVSPVGSGLSATVTADSAVLGLTAVTATAMLADTPTSTIYVGDVPVQLAIGDTLVILA